jgi:two-component system, chemotaxis family, CheB/CheR fusion protein
VLAWNRGAETLYGHAEADVLDTDLAALLPEPARAQHAQALQRLLAGERVPTDDVQRRRSDGSLLDVSASYSLIAGDDGKPASVVLIERDVTPKMRAERDLRESEQRFRTLADSAPVLIWMSRPDGSIEFANREFCSFTGLAAGSLAGRRWSELLQRDNLEAVSAKVAAARMQGSEGRVALTVQLRSASGEYRWMKLSAIQRLRDGGGLVGSMIDIDAQVGAEQELRAADRRKDEFLAMLGHELRNPLVPIRTADEVLARVAGDDARIRWVSDTLVRQVQHVTRLVDDLLNISLITRGALKLQLEPVDIGHAIQRAVEAARPLIERKRHRFECDLPDETLWVEGDSIRLTQVFENLLTNAARYTDEGGQMSLQLRRDGERAVVLVRDNGLGIGPSILSRVFDLFVQDERSIDRSQGGLGIGLALVRHLIELHRGQVEAHSEGMAGHANDGGRVMLVDDDAEGIESTAMLLRLYGYEVESASDLESGLQLAGRFRPHVVLIDLVMPRADGYEVMQRLQALPEMAGGAAYVAISGLGRPEDFGRTAQAGFARLLVKPVDPVELDRLLQSLLER